MTPLLGPLEHICGSTCLFGSVLANEAGEIIKINSKVYQLIIKTRNEKGWKRKDLAKQISVKPQVIESIETGKEKYDIKLIQKLERKLGVKLTGEAFK